MKIHIANDHKLWYDKNHGIATFRRDDTVYFVDENNYVDLGFGPERAFILYYVTKSKHLQQEYWNFKGNNTMLDFVKSICDTWNEMRIKDGRETIDSNYTTEDWDSKKDGWNYPQDKKLYMCNMIF